MKQAPISELDIPQSCIGSKLTWNCGRNSEDPFGHDRSWRYVIFRRYPRRFAKQMAHIYAGLYNTEGRSAANSWLRKMDTMLSVVQFRRAINAESLNKYAESVARICLTIALQTTYADEAVLDKELEKICRIHRVDFPAGSTNGARSRLCDALWWRRNLRKKYRRELEVGATKLNLIHRRASLYVSDENAESYRQQVIRNRSILQFLEATNELDQTYSLQELADLSVSNPIIKRSELMVRMAGTEAYAKNVGDIGVFYTLTCPSRMHSALSKTGNPNPAYDGTTPVEAQRYLTKLWSCIRAKLKRDNIHFYGLRVAEPHHDGTPHWHLLIFMRRESKLQIDNVISNYALKDSPDEKGASKHRLEIMPIDWKKGTATGYIAKYIAKNVDGFKIELDDFGKDAIKSAERVKAWSSLWGIRQFQFFGTASVCIWRELRRLNPEYLSNPELIQLVECARNNDWKSYFEITRKDLIANELDMNKRKLIRLIRIWNDKPGRYGDPIGYVIKGIEFDGVFYITRIHTWRIEQCNPTGMVLDTGNRGMVHEVERPPAGRSPAGGGPLRPCREGPRVNTFPPLEFYQ